MSSIRALTKYYIVSFLIVFALAFPDQGKRDFVLSQVTNMSCLITKLENIDIQLLLLQENNQNCTSLSELTYKCTMVINFIALEYNPFQDMF
jgi:hypothetical protein